jgi:hypothetical protein
MLSPILTALGANFLFTKTALRLREFVVVGEPNDLGSKIRPRRGRLKDLGFLGSGGCSTVSEATVLAGLA